VKIATIIASIYFIFLIKSTFPALIINSSVLGWQKTKEASPIAFLKILHGF